MPSLREPSYLTTTTPIWPRGLESILDYNNSAVVLNDLRRLDRIVVTSIGGLSGADLQTNAEKNPDRDGEQPLEATYGGRTITLRGYVEAGNLDKLRSLWSYMLDGFDEPTEAPLWMRWLDWRDQFIDSLALSDYAYDAGSGTLQIASDGTGLQPTSTASKEIRLLPIGPNGTSPSRFTHGDGEAIIKFKAGTAITGFEAGVELRRTSSTIKLRVAFYKATNSIRVSKINGGAPVQLATTAVGTLISGQDYYLVVRAEGAVITWQLWTSYPTDNVGFSDSGYVNSVPFTLSAGDQIIYPPSASGMGWGIYWTPNSTTDRISLYDVAAINPGDAIIYCRKSVVIEGEETQTDFQWRRDFLLTLRASDSRMISRKVSYTRFSPPGSPTIQNYYAATLTNNGRSPADFIVRFNGIYFNPRIFVPASGKILGLEANIGVDTTHVNSMNYGTWFQLDTSERTVIYNFRPSLVYNSLSKDSTWPQILRGSNEFRITADKFDDFYDATPAANLNGRVSAPSALGTWATSGTATDLIISSSQFWGDSSASASRATVSDAGLGRFGILGTTNYKDATIRLIFRFSSLPSTAGTQRMGIVARYTNSTNYFLCYVARTIFGWAIGSEKVITGVATAGRTQPLLTSLSINTWYELSLTLRTNGFYSLEIRDPSTDSILQSDTASYGDIDTSTIWPSESDLSPTGALATGKIGIIDYNPTATASTRYYGRILVRMAVDTGTIDVYHHHSSR